MLKIFYILFAIFIIGISSLKSQEELHIAFDAAVFSFDDMENRWELYYSIPDNMFSYNSIPEDNLFAGQINIRLEVISSDRVIIEDTWSVQNRITSTSELKNNYIFGLKSYLLPPGQYTANLYAFDNLNPTRKLQYSKNLIISKFEKSRINMSEIQLASYLSKIKDSNLNLDPIYMKYDYYLVPNPRAEYYGNESELIGAVEIYNTDKYSAGGFTRTYKITDNTGFVDYYSIDTCRDISDNILTVFDIPLDTLNSGVYFLTVSVRYPLENPEDSVSSVKKFFYFNQKKPPLAKRYFTENEMFEKSEFNTLTPEQTDLELGMAMMIGTEEEINQSKLISDVKAKQRFLFRFWKKRDTDTLTSVNETLVTFRQNVEFANSFFSYGKNKQGWKTERGRVLLKYGVPTQRDIRIGTGVERAYEEWFYENVQGGVHFYFIDMSAIGNYILVHSTAMDEIYYPDWQNRYVPTTQDGRMNNDLRRERNTVNPFGQ